MYPTACSTAPLGCLLDISNCSSSKRLLIPNSPQPTPPQPSYLRKWQLYPYIWFLRPIIGENQIWPFSFSQFPHLPANLIDFKIDPDLTTVLHLHCYHPNPTHHHLSSGFRQELPNCSCFWPRPLPTSLNSAAREIHLMIHKSGHVVLLKSPPKIPIIKSNSLQSPYKVLCNSALSSIWNFLLLSHLLAILHPHWPPYCF